MRKKTTTKKHRLYIIGGSIILLLVVIRLMLPYIVLHYANNFLAHVPDYRGHINDVDISLYRGAYQLDSFYLNKYDSGSGKQTPFLKIARTDLSVEWPALFDGRIVGKIKFYSPTLLFTKDKTEIGQVAKDTDDFRKVLKHFMPLKVNRFEVFSGSIHYIDNSTSPRVDVSLQDVYVLATNLKNTKDKNEKLPSTVKATASVYGGHMSMDMKLDGLSKIPTFDLNAEVKDANLVKVNDFLKAYGGFDVNRGTLGLYTECAAADGKFKGYVKPIIKDLKVLGPEDKNDKLGQKVKEAVIGLGGMILKNHKKDQIATKIPYEGRFDNPNANNGEAIWELLKNAFIEALMPSVDNEINITSAENASDAPKKVSLFKRIFGRHKHDNEEPQKQAEQPKKELGLRKYSTINK